MYAFLNRYTRAQEGLYRVLALAKYALTEQLRQSLPTAPVGVL